MSEISGGDSDFRINPPDLSQEKGPAVWLAKKIQGIFGLAPKPEAKPETKSTVSTPPAEIPQPPTGK